MPEKGGAPAYRLLHDVRSHTQKAGIAKVVIRTRQHLAALKAQNASLVLEIGHFADELVDVSEIKIAIPKGATGRCELEMAKTLVEQMAETWDLYRYTDDYTSSLMKMMETAERRRLRKRDGRRASSTLPPSGRKA